jgi:hypothetical protein
MIYFVTQEYLKRFTPINGNVDAEITGPLIEYSAKAFIKRQIGSYFFDDLFDKYNSKTLSAEETALVERMQLAIAWRVCANTVISTTYQITNKGLNKQNDTNSEAVELKEATFIYDHYIQQAGFFQKEMADFLLANKEDYPNFTNSLNKDSIIKHDSCQDLGGSFNEGVGFLVI